jgi:hypothetical protein
VFEFCVLQSQPIKKKKWNKEEIEQILHFKRNGIKLKTIGFYFSVSDNTIRKALTRHAPEYINKKKIQILTDPIFVTYDFILQWAKDHLPNLLLDNRDISQTSLLIKINQNRIRKGLASFKLNR